MKNIGVFNNTEEELDLKLVKKIAKYTFDKLGIKKASANIIFVDLEEIHNINRDYRKIDRPTDVISFALEDNFDVCMEEFRVLGDIYICTEKIKEQALEYGHTELREMAFLIVHGLLHLLGYDHMKKEDEEVMFTLQEEILNELKITR